MEIQHELISLMSFVNEYKDTKKAYLQLYADHEEQFFRLLETKITDLLPENVKELFMIKIDPTVQQTKKPLYSYKYQNKPEEWLEYLLDTDQFKFVFEFISKSYSQIVIRARGRAYMKEESKELEVWLYPELGATVDTSIAIYDPVSKRDTTYDYLVERLTTLYNL